MQRKKSYKYLEINEIISKKAKEGEFLDGDESFVSLTETKLDQLYKSSFEINKTLKNIGSRMNQSHDQNQLRKWDDFREKNMYNLADNSR